MNRINSYNVLWVFIITSLSVAATGNVLGQSKMPGGRANSLRKKEALEGAGLLSGEPNVFPFEIAGSRFLLNGKEVFLNIIGYQPLEPGQELWKPEDPEAERIRENRVRDDLRRWRQYQGGTDPIVVRVYPGPTENWPNRMPQVFYDGVRELGFWIIRDIYFYNLDPNEGRAKVDAVISEVNDANAFDLILAWEIGKEFKAGKDGSAAEIETFIENMCTYIKDEINEINIEGTSNWVTWQSWVGSDPFWTDYKYTIPIEPEGLDYISFNAYCYEPEQIRDHKPGPTTGTPYQGYLAALKAHYSEKPLVIVETGLSDSTLPEPDAGHVHERLHPWYPAYRKGGLRPEQVAEGLADRYWDARLLQDANDPNIVIAGLAIFEWSDEWHKLGEPNNQADYPEEHFGLGRFKERTDGDGYQLRYKLQQETIRELYTLKFDNDANIIESVAAESNTLGVDANTWVHAVLSDTAAKPVRFRWETNRGYIIGNPNNEKDANSVKFYAGGRWLGPAKITAVAIDANGNADSASITIDVNTIEESNIEILTFGVGVDTSDPNVRASGRVANVNLDEFKLVCYIYNWHFYIQPYNDMKSIWIGSDGYWWTKITNAKNNPGEFYCWLVPKSWDPPDEEDPNWSPPEYITEANTVDMDPNDYNDVDNDLLPDYWEKRYFNSIDVNDRYDDQDKDGANNLEEFLAGTSPIDANDPNGNDTDGDGLWDNWERRYFGDINLFNANDNPDGNDPNNLIELQMGTHPGRTGVDGDRDGLPDVWEIRWFGGLDSNGLDNPDGDCFNNLDEYELGLDPTSRMADLDTNCSIDFVDYSLFARHWREIDCNELNNWCGWADLDENGEINLADLCLLTENWLRRLY